MFLGPDSTIEDVLVTGILSGIGMALDIKDMIESLVYSEKTQYMIHTLLIGAGESPNNIAGSVGEFWKNNIS